jgi:hypothetical protein
MTLRSAGAWQQGWWLGAARRHSPNFGPRPPGAAVELVVVHSISLPPGVYGGDAIERLFANQLDPAGHPYFEQLRGLRCPPICWCVAMVRCCSSSPATIVPGTPVRHAGLGETTATTGRSASSSKASRARRSRRCSTRRWLGRCVRWPGAIRSRTWSVTSMWPPVESVIRGRRSIGRDCAAGCAGRCGCFHRVEPALERRCALATAFGDCGQQSRGPHAATSGLARRAWSAPSSTGSGRR